MNKKTVSGIMLTLLLIGMLTLAFNLQPVKAMDGTIYIRADGSIDPPTAPIQRVGDVYTFTDNIYDSIVVQKDNIVIDGNGYTLQGSGSGEGLYLSGIKGVTIKRTDIKGFNSGISLRYSFYNIIYGNTITANGEDGIWVSSSSNNSIVRNNIAANGRSGILFSYPIGEPSSSYNRIMKNNITNNSMVGIVLGYSFYSTINGNNITNNPYGISPCWGAAENKVYHNNFINTIQVFPWIDSYPPGFAPGNNIWDDGYPSGGNYWSGYTGVDGNSDGIGDAPYVINADNQDRYPLMYPWSSLPVHSINMGLGYDTIQQAINAPETLDGHTIFVEVGTYYGNVVVNKNNLKLIGENRENTIIDGNKTVVCVLATASNITLSGFTIKNAEVGMRIESDDNKIENNVVTNNSCGISIFFSNANTLRDNNVTGNLFNFGVEGYSLTDFIHNIDSTNIVDGKPIHYLINQSNLIIDRSTFPEIGYLAVINSTNVAVNQQSLSRNVQGVLFAYTNSSMIRDMNVSENSVGIYLINSDNNFIYNNVITANYRGFYIEHSNNSTIYHNNIIHSYHYQVLSFYSTNAWDNSYPSGGNFWSDYTGVDEKSGANQDKPGSDGIGDSLHTIDVNNQDRFPLIAPISVFDAGTWNGTAYHVDVASNSTVSNFQLNIAQKMISFNVTGVEGAAGFCRITIPNIIVEDLWQGNYTVLLNGEPWPFRKWTDTANTYICINYTHSEHEIIIIPEFPTLLILPLLFVIATLLAVTFYKRMHTHRP